MNGPLPPGLRSSFPKVAPSSRKATHPNRVQVQGAFSLLAGGHCSAQQPVCHVQTSFSAKNFMLPPERPVVRRTDFQRGDDGIGRGTWDCDQCRTHMKTTTADTLVEKCFPEKRKEKCGVAKLSATVQ